MALFALESIQVLSDHKYFRVLLLVWKSGFAAILCCILPTVLFRFINVAQINS